jgi:hypothetical protein
MYQNQFYPQYQQPFPQYGMTAQQRVEQMQQQYPQFAQMSPTQMSGTSQNVTWIPVNGLQGAKDHIVQPNQTAWLMDNNDMRFYVKSSDSLGVTTLKAYRFEEITDTAGQATGQIDMSQYVQRGEFEDLKAQIDKLSSVAKTAVNKANKEV